ncbi:MAG: hypothetical protein IPL01_11740 [Acidobacteria bacterium]|nr:hypothetical protein [Acidobacteriota bacterium]
MKFAKWVYLLAGISGLIILIPQYFTRVKFGIDYPPAITHPEFYYGFVGLAVVWQILFLVLSRDPERYRPMMPVTVLEKASFGFAVLALHFNGGVSPLILGGAIMDLVLGVLFLMAYFKTRKN